MSADGVGSGLMVGGVVDVGWLVGGVWIGAGVLALLVLAFCAYELSWKSRRLRTEGDRMRALGERAKSLQGEIAALQDRAAQLD